MNLAFIIFTSDKYISILPHYFTQILKYWPSFNLKTYVLTETKSINLPTNLNVTFIKKDLQNWGERIKASLDSIKEDLVIFSLEDFLLKDFVDVSLLNEAINIIKTHKGVNFISLLPSPYKSNLLKINPKFIKKSLFDPYRINLQFSLCKKSYLKRILRNKESPWNFEIYSSFRSLFLDGKILTLNNKQKPIFNYDYGFLLIKGKLNSNLNNYFREKENLLITGFPEITIEKKVKKRKFSFFKYFRYFFEALKSLFLS
jgi:hypothetical protein